MIRGAVIHLTGDQPLMADLFALPASADLGVLCTNLRTLDGKRPIFADHIESTFFFPYAHIRFVEIPPGATGVPELPAGAAGTGAAPVAPAEPPAEPEADLEIDEDLLRRIRDV